MSRPVCEKRRTVKIRAEEYEIPCGGRYCEACGLRWQGDMRVCAVAASEHLGGDVALVTITAPGRDYFAARGREDRIHPRAALTAWNEDARPRWRRFHLWAARPLREAMQQLAPGWRVLMRSWEYQRRGALHLHLVLPFGTDHERAITTAYVWNLWSGARARGFGYVLGGDASERPGWDRCPRVPSADGGRAARYVCKYVASVGAGKGAMVDAVRRTAQRGSIVWISPSLTRRSGVNMTKLRSRRRIVGRYPWAVESAEHWRTACLVDSVQHGRPPLARAAIERIVQAVRRTGACTWGDAQTGEVRTPTEAPMPPQIARTAPVRWRWRKRLDLVLAPVLLPDPTAPWLGPIRTDAVVVGA